MPRRGRGHVGRRPLRGGGGRSRSRARRPSRGVRRRPRGGGRRRPRAGRRAARRALPGGRSAPGAGAGDEPAWLSRTRAGYRLGAG